MVLIKVAGIPAEIWESVFYKRPSLLGTSDFPTGTIFGGPRCIAVRGHANHHPRPSPACTRTINARNRPPPVAGVSFGAGARLRGADAARRAKARSRLG